jgi:hypothetical protein
MSFLRGLSSESMIGSGASAKQERDAQRNAKATSFRCLVVRPTHQLLQNGLTLVMHFGNPKSSWYWPLILIYLVVFLVLAARAPRIMAAMRERITYPRSGYAEPGESVRKLSRAIVASTILAIFGLLLAIRYAHWDPDGWIEGMPVVGGLFFGVLGMYVAVRHGVLRYLLVGLFSIVLGLAINIEYPTWFGAEIWIVGVGCALLCAGGVTVWNFVRTTPPSAPAT